MSYPHFSGDCDEHHDLVRDFGGERPRIVCLCGSTKFGSAFAVANLELTLAGEIVLSIGCNMRDGDVFAGRDEAELAAVKAGLDDLHKRKIDLADYILVVSDSTGYFGSSTTGEIRYAVEHAKPVEFANPASLKRARDLGLLPPGPDHEPGLSECGCSTCDPSRHAQTGRPS